MDTSISIDKLLHNFYGLSYTICKYLGLMIFTLENNSLRFSFWSTPILFVALRALVSMAAVAYHVHLNSSPEQKLQHTESFVILLNVSSIVVTDLVTTLANFLKRQDIIKFHDNLGKLIKNLMDTTDNPQKLKCIQYIQRYTRNIRTLTKATISAWLIGTVGMAAAFETMLSPFVPKWMITLAPLVCAFWVSAFTIRYFSKVYLISILECVTICSTLIHKKIKSGKDAYHNILEMMQRLEDLILEANHALGVTLSVQILEIVVIGSTLSYQVILCIFRCWWSNLFFNGFFLLLNLSIIFVYCDVATRLEREIRKCATSLKKLSFNRASRKWTHFLQFTKLMVVDNHSGICPGLSFQLNRFTFAAVTYPLILSI